MSTASPTIINCTISGNTVIGSTAGHGGGIYCDEAGPTIVNTIVEGNSGGGGGGGGIYFDDSPNTSVTYGDFSGNGGGSFTGSVPGGLGTIIGVNANGDPCDRSYNIFLDPLFVDPFNGDYHLQANSPCIDAGDPTSPPDPDFTVADIGAFYYDQGIVPSITVTLTPQNPPIQIPAGGGSFLFDIAIENVDTMSVTFDGWTMAVLPNGGNYGPIILRTGLFLPVGGNITREDMTQFIPGGAPSGGYSYVANVGIYPDNIIASDSFPFEKLPGCDAQNHDYGWALMGWDSQWADFSSAPSGFELFPASPNPFNPETNLIFDLPNSGHVSLVIYDLRGREIARLADGFHSAGMHQITFNASQLSSGVYFACLTAGNLHQTRKMLLVK